ncbi:Zn-ribbon domain-containing OB-fold protein [Kineosporia babensis]|uniref:OB-fold domain-containing protein n=1 Tax=Kineosporia babensis TaxID=499548 RepID=A0A9X1SWH3_9ACTN|nr:OB-fold domain-containing protein [Kineosporia babensis]MCD5314005.1 OB-fold domain-containing protein [Kineosporia babensis]
MTVVRRDPASAAFYDAAAQHQLLMRRGPSGTVLPPEARTDPINGSPDLEPFIVSGTGTLISWAIVPGQATTALVELTEGPWLFVRLQADPAVLKAGLTVEVCFEDAGESVPVFRLS